jgi:hypothetical protein
VILPTKGISPKLALLTIGGEILRALREPTTVSNLWEHYRENCDPTIEVPFDWFILGLDLLYILGAIELDRGHIRHAVRCKEDLS